MQIYKYISTKIRVYITCYILTQSTCNEAPREIVNGIDFGDAPLDFHIVYTVGNRIYEHTLVTHLIDCTYVYIHIVNKYECDFGQLI